MVGVALSYYHPGGYPLGAGSRVFVVPFHLKRGKIKVLKTLDSGAKSRRNDELFE